MRVRLTKLDDQRHVLEVERDDRRRERVEVETRSTLLHDLTHFAVEQEAGLDAGFFGLLAAGKTFAELAGKGEEGMEAYTGVQLEIERTVAVLQKLLPKGEDPLAAHARITAMLALQGESPPEWFTPELVTRVHAMRARRPVEGDALREDDGTRVGGERCPSAALELLIAIARAATRLPRMETRLAPLVLAMLAPLSCPAKVPGGPEWHAKLDEAFALASETGQPLLIVFR
jgi:hypothetical protein